ncbi:MAG: endonuclease [Tissierellia bacterium]|nr:endonuclease [Tissierellia bacterium]
MKNKNAAKNIIFKIVSIVIFVILISLVLLILFLTITEFKPPLITSFEIEDDGKEKVSFDTDLKITSLNIGYASLGEEADFFMDGGKGVLANSKEEVEKNLKGIANILNELNADFNLLQEVDTNSKRSFNINQRKYFEENVFKTNSFYAENYKTNYVPFPIPPMGKVDSGLVTSTNYSIDHAERRSLSVPFKWPVRLANLKRCLLITKLPIEDSDKELVIINLHMEAYDDTGGRETQTRELLDIMEAEYNMGNYVIAAGDFNQSLYDVSELDFPNTEGHWTPGRIIEDILQDGFKYHTGDKKIPTSRLNNKPYEKGSEDTYHYIIDGYLVSPNINVKSVETIDANFKYTDHNPVVMEFNISE